MKHRPLRKVKKTPTMLITGVLLNLMITGIFYYGLRIFFITPYFLKWAHYVLKWLSIACFAIMVPSFVLSSALDPGFL